MAVTLKIVINEHTIFVWMDWILRKGEDFVPEKSYGDIRIKFLAGLPSQMQNEANVEKMRPDPSYNFPAVYPPLHINAGQAHPFGGQCDPRKLMTSFAEIWGQKLMDGLVRRGDHLANMVDDWADDDFANFAGKGKGKGKGGGRFGGRGRGRGTNGVFTTTTRCYQCGGLGHIYRFMRDGQQMTCPTIIEIPREVLDGITYPNIDRANVAGPADAAALPEDYNGPEDEAAEEVANMALGNWWD